MPERMLENNEVEERGEEGGDEERLECREREKWEEVLRWVEEEVGEDRVWAERHFKVERGEVKATMFLDLSERKGVRRLPYIEMPGDLILRGCENFRELPEGLWVRGYCDLRDCKSLERLPEKMSVGDYLDVSGCENLRSLGGVRPGEEVRAINCPNLEEVPPWVKDLSGFGAEERKEMKARWGLRKRREEIRRETREMERKWPPESRPDHPEHGRWIEERARKGKR